LGPLTIGVKPVLGVEQGWAATLGTSWVSEGQYIYF
jgi:hypothetical protein